MMRGVPTRDGKVDLRAGGQTDVCLIVEGCYPYVAGGVSSWVDWLMRTQPQLTFSVVAISSGHEHRQPRYQRPPNQVAQYDLLLNGAPPPGWRLRLRKACDARRLIPPLSRFIDGGELAELRELVSIVNAGGKKLSLYDITESPEAFEIVRGMYETLMPQASFLQFYWAWRALCGGLFGTLKFELPDARVYHAISTGYAGLLAARAAVETGRPAVVTEHGIYTNERRIEILMAEWISDTVDKGLNLDDPRIDLRDLWIRAFESYARACYAACSEVTTLYRDNQQLQLSLGAESGRLQAIANGIDVERFAALGVAPQDARPTMALIGRVVPIKDTRTFIAAAAAVRREIADIRALVMGPCDEDPAYASECRQLAGELGLEGCVEFTGAVRIAEWLPKVHVVVLTSLSEAQPLILLEAGAAGIPCVATNVGACREIIEGAGSEDDSLEPGGFITDLVSPQQVADCVCRLLRSNVLRRQLGENLRRRVRRRYASKIAEASYRKLYDTLFEDRTRPYAVELG
jgi:glycosyltransferase involved in cell wall biosynthesis